MREYVKRVHFYLDSWKSVKHIKAQDKFSKGNKAIG